MYIMYIVYHLLYIFFVVTFHHLIKEFIYKPVLLILKLPSKLRFSYVLRNPTITKKLRTFSQNTNM